jgi:hypothetical protein
MCVGHSMRGRVCSVVVIGRGWCLLLGMLWRNQADVYVQHSVQQAWLVCCRGDRPLQCVQSVVPVGCAWQLQQQQAAALFLLR